MNSEQCEILRAARGLLTSRDAEILQQTVEKLLAKIRSISNNQDDSDDLERSFFFEMAKISVDIDNIYLASVALKGLKCKQLDKIVISAIHDPSQDRKVVMQILSSHFEFGNHEADLKHDSLHIHQATTAKSIMSRLANARQNELDENFNGAIAHYEECGSKSENLPRVLMKHSIYSNQNVLQQYCLSSKELQNFHLKYLTVRRDYAGAKHFCAKTGMVGIKHGFAENTTVSAAIESMKSLLPELLIDFIHERSPSSGSQQPAMIMDSMLSLEPDCVKQLAEIFACYSYGNDHHLLRQISFCLGLTRESIDLHKTTSSKSMVLDGIVSYGTPRDFVDFTTEISMNSSNEQNQSYIGTKNRNIFYICLKLGLIDLALVQIAQNPVDTDLFQKLLIHYEAIINDTHSGTLEKVDPRIKDETLYSLGDILNRLNDNDLATTVITIVIFSSTVIFLKLKNSKNIISSLNPAEILFNYLENYIEKFEFGLSETLLRATSGLISAIKNNLDAVEDNELIRVNFRKLVEMIAGKCMIESRYKNAAMLYSHICDNVNAIKSLMRTGDVDTVINYALLVKDFTVNRITMNYLKHLKVDAQTIDKFAARSQI